MTETKLPFSVISEVLDIQQEIAESKINAVAKQQAEDQQKEFESVSNTLKNITEIGEAAVQDLADIARQTGEPRAFEVLAKLIKDTGDTAKGILDIRNDKLKTEAAIPGKVQNNTQNNIYITSPTDIIKKIKQTKAESNVEHVHQELIQE